MRRERCPNDIQSVAMRVGSLLLREATAADIERLLSFRNDPVVNRFMIRTSVEPETFRQECFAVASRPGP